MFLKLFVILAPDIVADHNPSLILHLFKGPSQGIIGVSKPISPVSVIIPNNVGVESAKPNTTAIGMLEHVSSSSQPPTAVVPSHVGCPQLLNLTFVRKN